MTATTHVASTDQLIAELVSVSLAGLPALRLDSGLYCYDLLCDANELRGESVRYSLMVLLGAQRADAGGHALPVDLDELWHTCFGHRHQFTPGDIGLALWAAMRRDHEKDVVVGRLAADLRRALHRKGALDALVGMELAWSVIGLAHAFHRLPGARAPFSAAYEHLLTRQAPSGLFVHDAKSLFRSRFPNFATEIYALLALATVARLGIDERALPAAERLAGELMRLQRADGGWPWLYDARRGTVIEPYEVYTVHQDAMAPMALLELTAATGNPEYADAARRGLPWSRGENELRADLVDEAASVIHRSIRRRPPWSRLAPATNSANAWITGHVLRNWDPNLEINRTCRPYHLGWILEAWGDHRPKEASANG